jgi:hypothetical protein
MDFVTIVFLYITVINMSDVVSVNMYDVVKEDFKLLPATELLFFIQ